MFFFLPHRHIEKQGRKKLKIEASLFHIAVSIKTKFSMKNFKRQQNLCAYVVYFGLLNSIRCFFLQHRHIEKQGRKKLKIEASLFHIAVSIKTKFSMKNFKRQQNLCAYVVFFGLLNSIRCFFFYHIGT